MKLNVLVGSGRKIGIFTLPFLIAGVFANIYFPAVFSDGGSNCTLFLISLIILIFGIIIWIWTVVLILTKIPKKLLITTGPLCNSQTPPLYRCCIVD